MIKLNNQKNEEKTGNEYDKANKNINVAKVVAGSILGVVPLVLVAVKKGAINTVKHIIFKR
ncbi:MAG TPA: hypothetical protein VIK78_01185 [Ruminiclostridium sp.]